LDGAADENRDGTVTLDELVHYTKRRVREYIDAEMPGLVQTPTIISALSGSVPLIKLENNHELNAIDR
jgi:hypothetical protein